MPSKQDLTRRAARELREVNPDFILPVYLGISDALSIIGNLQLALRHPGNHGPSADVARAMIDGLIEQMIGCGLTATAELARLGDDPAYDS